MRRLSPAFLTVAMLGVVGLLVVLYVGKKLLAREAPVATDPRISVPMALADMEPGTVVTEAFLAMGPADRSKIKRDTILTNRALIGRVVRNKITAAQPISTQDLYGPGETPPLGIDENMTAVTISAPAPFVAKKGQYVNVHFIPTADPDSERTGGQILTLFQGVKVLALSSSTASRSTLNVTLELTREQANIILLAKDKGTLNFTFAPGGKGTGVVAVSDKDRATLYEILGYSPTPPVPPVPPVTTDIFQGTSHGVNRFINGRFVDQYNQNNGQGGGPGGAAPGVSPAPPMPYFNNGGQFRGTNSGKLETSPSAMVVPRNAGR